MPPGFLSAAEYAEILAYNQAGYTLAALTEPINLALLALWVGWLVRPFYRWAEALAQRLRRRAFLSARWQRLDAVLERLWGGPGWGTALLFTALCSGFLALAALPVQVWLGFFHEHAHGLSRASWTLFTRDLALDFAQRLAIRLVLAFGLYALARRLRHWWLVLGLVSGTLLLGMALLDPVRTALEVAHHPLPAGPLETSLRSLLARDQVPFAGIVVVESSRHTTKADAVFSGEGPTRQILLADNLVDHFPPAEVLGAVAHEAGHAHEPRWPGRLLGALTLVLFLFAVHATFRWAQRRGWFGAREYADIRTLPLLTILMYGLVTVGQPLSAQVARQRELAADRHAVELTSDPAAFRSLLQRLARVNKMDPWPPRWFVLRGLMHPPIGERLAQLDALWPPGSGDAAHPEAMLPDPASVPTTAAGR